MQVGSATQMHLQMRTGGNAQGAQGQNGMKSVMQNLSADDKTALQEQMSGLSQTDKADLKSQLLAVDPTSMSAEDYASTILNLANSFGEQEEIADSTSIEVYA